MEQMGAVSIVEKILVNEVENKQHVYLYLEGDNWCAYERSAYYLAQLNLPIQLQCEIVRDGYDVILLKACVPMNFLDMSKDSNMTLKRFGETDVEFKLLSDIYGFPEWKMSQLNVLSA